MSTKFFNLIKLSHVQSSSKGKLQTERALYFFVLLDLYKTMTMAFLEKIMIKDYNKAKATEFFCFTGSQEN